MKVLQVVTSKGVEELEIIHQHKWYGRDAVVKTKDGSYAKAAYDYKHDCFRIIDTYNPRFWDKGMVFRFNGLGGLE